MILLTDDLGTIKLFKEQAEFLQGHDLHQFGLISTKIFTLEEVEEHIEKIKNGIEDINDADLTLLPNYVLHCSFSYHETKPQRLTCQNSSF